VVQLSKFIVPEGVSNESTAKIQANEIINDCRVHKEKRISSDISELITDERY